MDEKLPSPLKKKKGKTERQSRLGAALRENLRKRKAQSQQRQKEKGQGTVCKGDAGE